MSTYSNHFCRKPLYGVTKDIHRLVFGEKLALVAKIIRESKTPITTLFMIKLDDRMLQRKKSSSIFILQTGSKQKKLKDNTSGRERFRSFRNNPICNSSLTAYSINISQAHDIS